MRSLTRRALLISSAALASLPLAGPAQAFAWLPFVGNIAVWAAEIIAAWLANKSLDALLASMTHETDGVTPADILLEITRLTAAISDQPKDDIVGKLEQHAVQQRIKDATGQWHVLCRQSHACFASPARTGGLVQLSRDADLLFEEFSTLHIAGLVPALSVANLNVLISWHLTRNGDVETFDAEYLNARAVVEAAESLYLQLWSQVQVRQDAGEIGPEDFQVNYEPHFAKAKVVLNQWDETMDRSNGLWKEAALRSGLPTSDLAVYFAPGGTGVLSTQRAAVKKIARQYEEQQHQGRSKILLRACVDRAEAAAATDNGVSLARSRCDAVRDALVGEGVPGFAISADPLGAACYVAGGDLHASDMPENRVVSIEFYDSY